VFNVRESNQEYVQEVDEEVKRVVRELLPRRRFFKRLDRVLPPIENYKRMFVPQVSDLPYQNLLTSLITAKRPFRVRNLLKPISNSNSFISHTTQQKARYRRLPSSVKSSKKKRGLKGPLGKLEGLKLKKLEKVEVSYFHLQI
jgi:hypothetical protein